MKKHGVYYNEVGIKISNFRLSVRFPCGPLNSNNKNKTSDDEDYGFAAPTNIHSDVDHYKSDWTWVPVKSHLPSEALPQSHHSSPTSSCSGLSRNTSSFNRPLPPPPVPPRAASPSTAPSSAIPPYPSSTVSRHSKKSSRSSCTSYVWKIAILYNTLYFFLIHPVYKSKDLYYKILLSINWIISLITYAK